MIKNGRMLVFLLLILSAALTALGGFMDMSGTSRIYGFSKKHAWHDGLYLAVLAIPLSVLVTCAKN